MTNEHIVGKFDDELSRIKSEILEMGDLVIEQIYLSTNAMMSLDTEDIDNLIQKDLKINGMYKTINRHAEQIIAMRQPVACLLYTSPSPRDLSTYRMPSSA